MRRLLRSRTFISFMTSGALLQVGACNLSAVDREQLTLDLQNVSDVVVGNLAANTVGFFLNSLWLSVFG